MGSFTAAWKKCDPPMNRVEQLEKLLRQGQDNALLRFGLGAEYLRQGQPQAAVEHLRQAVGFDAGYSAAWKLLGQALTAAGLAPEAQAAYQHGIAAAEGKGDVQAAKEMRVFLKRLGKASR